MCRILVSAMAYDKGKSGISVYINETIRALSADNYLTLLMLESDYAIFPIKNDNIEFQVFSDSLAPALRNMLWHLFALPGKIDFDKYDFLFLPAGNRRLFWKYPIFTIATLHDLSQYHIPGKYDPFRMFYIKRVVPFFLKKAHHIVTVSESTLRDAAKYYHMPEEKMSVNYNGYDETAFFSNININQSVLEKYDIKENFILYISRIEHPGKNHLNLIKAYELLPNKIKKEHPLVLGGSFWPGSEEVREYAENSLDADKIKFIGFVPESDMATLYKAALFYIFPSFFEGFGLSLVEAMACGTPVLCSNTSSLPEIGGDAVLLFDPDSAVDISERMRTIINNSTLRSDMREKGLLRLQNFSWKRHAEKIVEIYEQR